jgi:hypothetical protein
LTGRVKKLADHGFDDHPPDDAEWPQLAWVVATLRAALALALREIGEQEG